MPERFGRRQGYAFITFEDASDVDKAVAEVNGKELLGREMRVQKATSGGPYTSENGDGENTGGEARKLRPRPRAKVYIPFSTCPRKMTLPCLNTVINLQRVTRRTPTTTREDRTVDADAPPEDAEKPLKPRHRTPKKAIGDEGVSEEADGSGDRKNIARRRPARKGPPEDGTPSTTTIYVSNIPFEYTDDKVYYSFQVARY